MIRVLQIVGSLGYAGLEAVIMNYYRNIDIGKIQFDFVVCSKVRQRYDDEIEAKGGKIYRLPLRAENTVGYTKALFKIIKENQYNIIHINQNSASMAIEAFVAKLCGVKNVIGHSHSTYCNVLWWHYLFKPFVNMFINYRFACSEAAGRWVFGKHKPVKVLNNAIDAQKYAFVPEIREKYRKDFGFTNELILGFVGRLGKEKNLSRALEIFAEVKKSEEKAIFIIVGNGNQISKLKLQAQELGISDCVKFLGMRDDIPSLMMMFDVFIMTSLFEGMPVVSAEAQATGLHCVFSTNVPSPDLIGNVDFLPLSASNKEWAQAILKEKYLDRVNVKENIISKGYDISTVANELQEFYNNLK